MAYSQDIADRICAGLAEGMSLRAVCRKEGMPAASTVLGWLDDEEKKDFAEQYASARARGYQLLADEILEISDDSAGDVVVDSEGNERTDAERVARSRLRVDSRKWMLSKMLPKVYGDRQVIAGDPDAPLKHDHTVGLQPETQRFLESMRAVTGDPGGPAPVQD